MKTTLVLTCEHGGNHVPKAFCDLFARHADVLKTHRGWDPGALELARELSHALHCQDRFYFSETTRLLVELNRSLGHKNLFSAISKELSEREREQIKQEHYFPYRNAVIAAVEKALAAGTCVIQLSIHSFTPVLHGEVRQTDIGLLYHPKHALERHFCELWRERLEADLPSFRTRMNYPYRGTSNSFTTELRRNYPENRYLGLELEFNQKYPEQPSSRWQELKDGLLRTLRSTLDIFSPEST